MHSGEQILDHGDLPPVLIWSQDQHQGPFTEMFTKALAAANLTAVDMTSAVSDLLACKDPEEIKKAKKAAYLAATALQKYAVPQFESEYSQCKYTICILSGMKFIVSACMTLAVPLHGWLIKMRAASSRFKGNLFLNDVNVCMLLRTFDKVECHLNTFACRNWKACGLSWLLDCSDCHTAAS